MELRQVFYSLQACRGIAALMVLLGHATIIVNPKLLNGFFIIGWSGVDFFFVLSGFIIFYTNSKFLGSTSSFIGYLIKRFVRVYPVYWIYAIGFLIIHFLASHAAGIKLIFWMPLDTISIVKSLLLYPSNFKNNVMPIIPAAWSLSYEVLFYLIFGICILVNKKYYLYVLAMWVLAIVSVYLTSFSQSNNLLAVFTDIRNLEFVFGCLIAKIVINGRHNLSFRSGLGIFLIGLMCLGLSWFNELSFFILFPKFDVVNFGLPFVAIISGLIVMEANSPIVDRKGFLVYLGDASYSIYLSHLITLNLAKIAFNHIHINEHLLFVSISVMGIIVGCALYSCLEKPLLSMVREKPKPVSLVS